MADSTLNETAQQNQRRDDIYSRRTHSVGVSDLFIDALREYMNTSTLLDETDTRGSALVSAAGVVHWSATNLVIAAADYHCARRVFEAQKALIEPDQPQEEEEA